jgi:HPt (histidine-containing phosphotransfer) domain-containing protein
MEDRPAIDLPEALNRAMGDAEFLRMLLDELHNTIPDFRSRLIEAHQAGDLPAMGKTAHQLKGAAANLGAGAIAAAALKLEQIGKSGDPAGCGQAFEDLDQAVANFEQCLSGIDWTSVGGKP